jgi:hypothetical protein
MAVCAPIISAAWDAQVGRLLEPMNLRPGNTERHCLKGKRKERKNNNHSNSGIRQETLKDAKFEEGYL